MLVCAPFAKGKKSHGFGRCFLWNFEQLPTVPLDCAVVRSVLSELQSELQQNERVLGQVIGQGEWI